MDSFTQRMLEQEQAEQGISKSPLTEYNQDASLSLLKRQNSPTKTPSSSKRSVNSTHNESNSALSKNTPQRISSADVKENVDVALEIHTTAEQNVQVQPEIEERNVDEHGIVNTASKEYTPMNRDFSRNRLQIHSELGTISSPIHRNQARFDDEIRGKSIIGKFAGLASGSGPVVTKGLVSDRAATFEIFQKPEIMRKPVLFEKNKLLIPKAALVISASDMYEGLSANQNTPEKPKVNSYNEPVFAESTGSRGSIRNTVAASVSNATKLSESQVCNEIRKQHAKELNSVLSRFNRPFESTSLIERDVKSNALPVKPVQHMTSSPAASMSNNFIGFQQRSADANSYIKSNDQITDNSRDNLLSDEVVKCMQVNPIRDQRLYSVTKSDGDDGTTATISERRNEYQHRYNHNFEEESRWDKLNNNQEDGDSFQKNVIAVRKGQSSSLISFSNTQSPSKNDRHERKLNTGKVTQ